MTTDDEIQDFFGLKSLSNTANKKYKQNKISVIILNANPFPAINGKNIDEDTIKGMNGIRKMPETTE
jgi:hypothetical protein